MKQPKNLEPLYLIIFAILFFGHSVKGQLSDFENHNFNSADSIAAIYVKHPIDNLQELSGKLTSSLPSDLEKFRAIYKWVCDNIENDYDFYLKNKRMREKLNDNPVELKEWNRNFHPKVFNKLVKEYKTVCTGYAYLIKELAYYANIEVELINGYGRTAQANIGGEGIPNHSWNAVNLNDKWYLCDATWSSGSINPQQSSFLKEFSEGYFLSEPNQFVKNHYPLDTNWILLKRRPTLEEFLNGPLVYKGAFNHQIILTQPSTFHVSIKKGESLTFSFSSILDLSDKSVEIQQRRGSSETSTYSEIYKDGKGFYCLDQFFNRRGLIDVHLLIDGDYIVTYSVEVLK